jgi:hypothetical protein
MDHLPGDWVETVRRAADHREFVGPGGEYDINGALQFSLLVFLGMRESDLLLDIGCGSLRGGRFAMAYLQPDHYFAIEPERWLVEAAIEREIGRDLVRLKRPTFDHGRDFGCGRFGRVFDFILAQGVFTHAPLADIAACTSAAAGCMGPQSVFLATFMEGETDYDGVEWRYPQTSWYTPARMARTAAAADLVTVPIPWPHPRNARWLGLCRPGHAPALNALVAGLPVPRLLARRPIDDTVPRATVLGSLATSARRLAGSLGRRLRRSVSP